MNLVKFKEWNCVVEFSRYANGRVSMRLSDAYDYSPVATATVNLHDYPEFPIEEGQVHIKNYSENEGITDALVKAGIVEELAAFGIGQFAAPCSLCKLLVEIPE